jgi:hypothetical protein
VIDHRSDHVTDQAGHVVVCMRVSAMRHRGTSTCGVDFRRVERWFVLDDREATQTGDVERNFTQRTQPHREL